ncbi:MAG: excinuclease ABC subunit C, partial [Dehalococcoidia bacterium]|nr:excinuclease ABC subunit C [Dehalococcoidia bacterium]
VDGGKGHLSCALEAVRESAVEKVPVAAIAKENEEIFVQGRQEPIALARDSQALYLLQRIRDEAHRFALSYHTKMRKKRAFTSSLDVPGIGPKRRRALLRHFGSIKAIKAASAEEIASVPGMTRPLALKLKTVL